MGDKTKGKAKQVEGKVKQTEGEAQEMWGDVKAKAEKAKDRAEDAWDDAKDEVEERLDGDKDRERETSAPRTTSRSPLKDDVESRARPALSFRRSVCTAVAAPRCDCRTD